MGWMVTQKILIAVAHSDDETISMAGTIRKHIVNGDTVQVVSMTNGVGARDDSNEKMASERMAAAAKASEILGFKWEKCFDFNDNALDSYPLLEIVKALEAIKNTYNPSLVYTHSGSDLNIDHRVVTNAVLTAFRPQPQESCKEIRLFEVPSATDFGHRSVTGAFIPNLYVNITDYWETKLRALGAYSAELRKYPHSRSIKGIENLARLRGSQVGFELAESFEVIRRIID